MEIIIDAPITEEEIENEFEEQTEDFRKKGLLPIESEDRDERDI